MRVCRRCGGFVEDHEVLGTQQIFTDRGPIPGQLSRIYQCDLVRTGSAPAGQGRTMPVYRRKGAVRND